MDDLKTNDTAEPETLPFFMPFFIFHAHFNELPFNYLHRSLNALEKNNRTVQRLL